MDVAQNGVNSKCYKIGFTKNMKSRIAVYKTGNYDHKLISYIPINLNGRELEKCVKSIYPNHILKRNTDTICYITLKELKDTIAKCVSRMNDHICHCVICKKKYKFSRIDKHICGRK
jgi:hypothetical protein